jgi:hypothetical protein
MRCQVCGARIVAATEAATPATIRLLPGWHIVYQNALTTASNVWPTDAHCYFGADGYHVKDGYICPPDLRAAHDVHVAVQVKQVGGELNAYGIALRYVRGAGLYEFVITRFGDWGFVSAQEGLASLSRV